MAPPPPDEVGLLPGSVPWARGWSGRDSAWSERDRRRRLQTRAWASPVEAVRPSARPRSPRAWRPAHRALRSWAAPAWGFRWRAIVPAAPPARPAPEAASAGGIGVLAVPARTACCERPIRAKPCPGSGPSGSARSSGHLEHHCSNIGVDDSRRSCRELLFRQQDYGNQHQHMEQDRSDGRRHQAPRRERLTPGVKQVQIFAVQLWGQIPYGRVR